MLVFVATEQNPNLQEGQSTATKTQCHLPSTQTVSAPSNSCTKHLLSGAGGAPNKRRKRRGCSDISPCMSWCDLHAARVSTRGQTEAAVKDCCAQPAPESGQETPLWVHCSCPASQPRSKRKLFLPNILYLKRTTASAQLCVGSGSWV